jgi:hypothetical protein
VFRSNSCVAFSWDDEGRCCGVRIERNGERCTVVNHWRGARIGNQSQAEVIESGLSELKIGPETAVIVGGNFRKACFVDLRLPKMAHELVRGALGFELTKHTPIPLDDIQWGYRVLGKLPGTETHQVRVTYFPRDQWEHWISAGSAIGSGVDAIIPASGVLDPMMGEMAVGFAENDSDMAFILRPQGQFEREIEVTGGADQIEGVFGLGHEPLAHPNLVLGELGNSSAAEQRAFAASVVLGMYGVSEAFTRDRKTWMPVPLEMRPRRNRMQKTFTTLAAIYIVGLLCYFGMLKVYENHKKLQKVTVAREALEKEVKDIRRELIPEGLEFDDLELEIQEARGTFRSLGLALIAFTGLTGDELWSTSFSWTDGGIRAELRAEEEATEAIEYLMRSQTLTDFSQEKSVRPGGEIVYTVQCRAKTHAELAEEEIGITDEQFVARVDLKEETSGSGGISPPAIPSIPSGGGSRLSPPSFPSLSPGTSKPVTPKTTPANRPATFRPTRTPSGSSTKPASSSSKPDYSKLSPPPPPPPPPLPSAPRSK